MAKEYQKLNPSNARLTIDYEKDDVKMEYVHHESAFKVCFSTLLVPTWYIEMFVISIAFIIYYGINSSGTQTSTGVDSIQAFWIVFLAFFTIVGLMLPIYIVSFIFSKNERLLKMIPDINFLFGKLRGKSSVVTFKPKDVKNNRVEIPLFSNVGLDYDATGGFSTYLRKVEIKEHPFKVDNKGKVMNNPYLWRARFYFNDTPRNGRLKVEFI